MAYTEQDTVQKTITWKGQSAVTSSVYDILDMPALPLSVESITEKLMESSFFLPLDILAVESYKVSPIFVLNGHDFAKLYDQLVDESSIHCDCDYFLLAYAKSVGVSLRINKKTGQRHTVLKLWYGKNPWQKLDAGSDAQYANKLANLHRFLKNEWKL